MRILIRATHYPVASGRYMMHALKRLGHDVHTEGPSTGNQIWGMTVEERYIWTPDAPGKGWTPELVLHMDAHLEPVAVPDGALHVVYGVDNHVRDYRFDETSPYPFDHLFLAHGNGYRIGEDNVTWLPCGYDPQLFQPGPMLADRQFDAAMVGVDYGPRAELRYVLISGVPHFRMVYGTGALFEQYAGAYQSARLSIVRSAKDDVAQRVWETAAMGCVVVMDRVHDAAALGLVDGENCLMYSNPAECAVQVGWALSHPDAAQRIADAGREWAQPGTWDERAQMIIDWAEARLGARAQKAAAK